MFCRSHRMCRLPQGTGLAVEGRAPLCVARSRLVARSGLVARSSSGVSGARPRIDAFGGRACGARARVLESGLYTMLLWCVVQLRGSVFKCGGLVCMSANFASLVRVGYASYAIQARGTLAEQCLSAYRHPLENTMLNTLNGAYIVLITTRCRGRPCSTLRAAGH
jgi:hypothetical protein